METLLHYAEHEARERYELLPDNQHSNGLAASVVIPGAHELYGFTVLSTNVSAQYIQVFDLASLPADGSTPDAVFYVAASNDKAALWLPARKMLQGVVICNSSTAGTKTIGAADCFFDVQFG